MNFVNRISQLEPEKKNLLAKQLGFWVVETDADQVLIVVQKGNNRKQQEQEVRGKLKSLLIDYSGVAHIAFVDEVHFLENGEIDTTRVNAEDATSFEISNTTLYNDKHKETIPAVGKSESYPLSAAQKRMWVLSNFKGGSEANNLPTQIRMDKDINLEALRKAINKTIERHETLRTTFKADDSGEVKQWVHEVGEIHFELDYSDLQTSSDQQVEINNFLENDFNLPFDLENGLLFRAVLFKLNHNEFLLCYNMHHIISDGDSITILSRDIMEYYHAELNGVSEQLPELPVQYKDFSVWQNEQVSNGKLRESETYWRELLEGGVPKWNLEAARSRPVLKTFNGASLGVIFASDSVQKQKEFAAKNKGTLFTSIVSSVNALLHTYSGQEELILGIPVSGREMAVLEHQIGLYVNTLIIKNSIEETDSYLRLFNKVKQNLNSGLKHKSYPFDLLVDQLNVKRDVSRGALFDIMVSFQENVNIKLTEEEKRKEATGEIINYGKAISKFDLNFSFKSNGDSLSLNLVYNTDIYPDWLIRQILMHYRNLFGALVHHSDQLLDQICLDGVERNSMSLFKVGLTTRRSEETITSKFKSTRDRHPERLAVISDENQLTYKELDLESNRLANFILDRYGNKAEEFIGIQLKRNEWWLISILAVLKSNKAYIPIDENSPADRTTFILQNSKSIACINEKFLDEFQQFEGKNETDPAIVIAPDQLAYMIYTSGTTGIPKGVQVEQHSIVNYNDWFVRNFNISEMDSSIITSSPSFDGVLTCLYGTLLEGGTLHIIGEEKIKNAKFTTAYIREHRITFLKGTPTYLNYLLQVGNADDLLNNDALKLIITGGEKASLMDVQRIVNEGSCRIINHYGPTECTVGVAYHEITKENLNKFIANPVIGKGIEGAHIAILNKAGKTVPKGVLGEIVVSGNALARGYLGENNGGFGINPQNENERAYFTGDYGYYTEDNTICFVGRRDDQVKIRGNRIELGEIIEALRSTLEIDTAFVNVIEEDDSNVLVAYYVSEQELEPSLMRDALKLKLQDFMIPAYFVHLYEMPISKTGKIDTSKLPSPERRAKNVRKAPVTDQEKLIVELWQKVLNKETVWVNDDFFEIGGHSLKAMKLINAYEEAFGVRVTLSELFRYSILEDHVQLLENGESIGLPIVGKIPDAESYEASPSQKRLWALCQREGANSAHNIPRVYKLSGKVNAELLNQAFYGVIERHEVLRTTFKLDEKEGLRQVPTSLDEFVFSLHYESHIGVSNEAVKALIKREVSVVFDLEKGPLIRATLLQIEEDQFVLTYVIHHLIADGWSMELILNELLESYAALSKGIESKAKTLPIQFRDYAAWQSQMLEEDRFQKDLEYWKVALPKDLVGINLQTDKDRPKDKSYKGGLVSKTLSDENIGILKEMIHNDGGTVFMGLLSVLNVLLHNYSGQKDILIGTPVAGRTQNVLEDQVGFYVNTLALLNTINLESSFGSLFERVKMNTIDAFSHQNYPFDELFDKLNLSGNSSGGLLNVMIVLHNIKISEPKNIDGLSIQQSDLAEHIISKLDLIFNFFEVGGAIELALEYNADIFSRESIEIMVTQFDYLLGLLSSNAQTSMKELSFTSLEEKNTISKKFNNTKAAIPNELSIIDMFKKQVEKIPENTAVIFEAKKMSFRELDEASGKFASYLKSNYAIAKGDFVAVRMERNPNWVVAILAVLKCGAGYVPIDMNLPDKRRAFIEENSNCKTCIELQNFEEFVNGADYDIIDDVLILPKDPAYIIYTSGSTGVPKGVIGTHVGLVNRISWSNRVFPFSEEEVCCAKTTPAFVDHLTELFVPLVSGIPIAIVDKETLISIDKFLEFLNINRVTRLVVVPSLLSAVLKVRDQIQDKLASLKLVYSSGEKLTANVINDFHQTFEGKRLVNLYGSSEVTGDVTFIETRVNQADNLIGQPIDNTEIFILDSSDNPCQIGIRGEIVVKGLGLSLGYVNNPEETNKAFTVLLSGERVYKTGDFGRWMPDGNIQFLGRTDSLIKIRGMQISLQEVRKELTKHPSITNAEVMVNSRSENESLVAAFESKEKLSDQDLTKFLAATLPAYMIPTKFARFDKFPETINGKVDRQALKKEVEESRVGEYIPAKTDTERVLVELWEEVLEKKGIGVEDDFFKVGGHSLTAAQMVSRMNRKLDVKLAVGVLFKDATIRNVGRKIDFIKSQEEQKLKKDSEYKEIDL